MCHNVCLATFRADWINSRVYKHEVTTAKLSHGLEGQGLTGLDRIQEKI